MATVRGASRPLTPGHRVHLYTEDASVAAELNPEQFDWNAFSGRHGSSVLLNCKRLMEELLHRAAGMELDRGFDLEPVVLSRSLAVSELESVLAEVESRQGGVVHDNEVQFRFYARWRYLVARAEYRARREAKSPR